MKIIKTIAFNKLALFFVACKNQGDLQGANGESNTIGTASKTGLLSITK